MDAQLFDFDISPDLSLHLEPVVSPKTKCHASYLRIELQSKNSDIHEKIPASTHLFKLFGLIGLCAGRDPN